MKRALALCGGGSKGSYEMGVWQALRELNIKFDIVCGTSIGALNAAMVCQDRYEENLELWKKTRNETILKNPINIDETSLKKTFKNMTDFIPFLKNYIKEKGADITPFRKTLDYYVDEDRIINSKMDIGVVCVSFPGFKPYLINLKEVKKEHIKSFILASASCFPLFPICKIDNINYIDGGYYDNLPIDFCLDLGAHEIVAVDLNFNITHKEYLHKPFVTYIHPSWDLGGFFNFTEELINHNIILGYNDTLKKYGKFLGFRYSFYKEDINYISKKFVTILANVIKDFRKSKIKSLYKDDISLYEILEKYTYKENMSYEDYYLRAIEELLEYMNIDHLKVYKINSLCRMLEKKVINYKVSEHDLFSKYAEQKTRLKKREYLNKCAINDILTLGYNQITNGKILTKDFVLDVLAVNPYVVIYLILEMVWSDIDAEEEKNFGFTFEFED